MKTPESIVESAVKENESKRCISDPQLATVEEETQKSQMGQNIIHSDQDSNILHLEAKKVDFTEEEFVTIEVDENPVAVGGELVASNSLTMIGKNTHHRSSTLRDIYWLFFDGEPFTTGQVGVWIGALLLSSALVALVFVFKDQFILSVHPGIFLGSLGTLICCGIVIGCFIFIPGNRRHTNSILFQRSVADFCLGLSFLLPSIILSEPETVRPEVCKWLAIIREYFLMVSSTWGFCIALDLHSLLTDPFTIPRKNRQKYFLITNILGIAAAFGLLIDKSFYGPSIGGICWVKSDSNPKETNILTFQPATWIFIACPVVAFLLTNVYVVIVARRRLQYGLEATIKGRRKMLREGFLTTLSFIVYWILLWGLYSAYWISSGNNVVVHLFLFVLAYRGIVVFLLWFVHNKPELQQAETEQDESEAVRPQENDALLKELVFYTTQGISTAVQHTFDLVMENEISIKDIDCPSVFTVNRLSTSSVRSTTTRESIASEDPAHFSFKTSAGCKVTDFRPMTFYVIREHFGISCDEYLSSLQKCNLPKLSEGASGSFMFFTSDRSYIIKSLSKEESQFLNLFSEKYMNYVIANPSTFLSRFLGSYGMVLYGKESFFVVMENIFDIQPGVAIHQRYDIKGSWIHRNAQKPRKGSESTCRHCDKTYISGGSSMCKNKVGAHEPNIVLKDMDLTTKLRLGDEVGRRVICQLDSDSNFLCNQGIMDYSLLIGMVEVSYDVDPNFAKSRDSDNRLPAVITANQPFHKRMSTKHANMGLFHSKTIVGPGYHYLGMIDLLQQWTVSKKMESFFKRKILRQDSEGISAIPPDAYKDRFMKKIHEIVFLSTNKEELATPNVFTLGSPSSPRCNYRNPNMQVDGSQFSIHYEEDFEESPQNQASVRS